MDAWNTTFLLGRPIFRCELLVSGRVIFWFYTLLYLDSFVRWSWRKMLPTFHDILTVNNLTHIIHLSIPGKTQWNSSKPITNWSTGDGLDHFSISTWLLHHFCCWCIVWSWFFPIKTYPPPVTTKNTPVFFPSPFPSSPPQLAVFH